MECEEGLCRWAFLPDDLLFRFAGFGDAQRLCVLLGTCRAWRVSLLARCEDLWRAFALARFPRLKALLAASTQPPDSFCALYRNQLMAEGRIPTPVPRFDFSSLIFTVEIDYKDEPVLEWVGKAPCDVRVSDGCFELDISWSSDNPVRLQRQLEAIYTASPVRTSEVVRIRIFVTRELRTTCLYSGAALDCIQDDVLQAIAVRNATSSHVQCLMGPAIDLPVVWDVAYAAARGQSFTPVTTCKLHFTYDHDEVLSASEIQMYFVNLCFPD